MPLSLSQKSDIRRHLKFAVGGLPRNSPIGGGSLGSFAGFRWAQAWGMLEFIMNNLAADEEARLLGNGYGAVALMGPLVKIDGTTNPQPGDEVSITFSGGNLTGSHTVTTTAVAGDSLLTLCARIASTVNQDATMQAAGIQSLAPFGTGAFSQNYVGANSLTGNQGNPAGNVAIPLPEVSFQSDVAFTVASVTSTGVIGAAITATGVQLPPFAPVNWTVLPYGTVYGYLPICDYLEGSKYGASPNLSTAQAGGPLGVTFRMDEVKERTKLYRHACMEMTKYLFGESNDEGLVGRRGGPGIGSGGTRMIGI